MSASTLPPLPNVLCLNINGWRDVYKRRRLFHQLLHGPWSAVVLTETHSEDDVEVQRWVREGAGPGMPWQGPVYSCHGNNRRKGVAILMHHQWVAEMVGWHATVVHACSEGRVLKVEWQPPASSSGGKPLAIVGVYAPVEAPLRREFYSAEGALASALAAGAGLSAAMIVAGDFNCVLERRDVFGNAGPGGGGRMIGGSELAHLMSSAALVDAWRHVNPSFSDFTHVAMQGEGTSSSGRIDMCLVSEPIITQGHLVACTHIHAKYPGDHVAVAAKFRNPELPREGMGCWRFPTSLLQEQAFKDTITSAITQAAVTWTPRSPAALACPATHRWEAIKAAIQLSSRRYVAGRRVQHRQAVVSERVSVMQAAHAVVQPYQPHQGSAGVTYAQHVQAARSQIQQDEDARRVATDALWQRFGEQGTKWFHRLGQVPHKRVPLLAVQGPGGARVSLKHDGKSAMDAAITSHFVGPNGVFAPSHIDQQASAEVLDSIAATVPVSLHAHIAGPNGDGSISNECLLSALRQCPPGRAPGLDGLAYEVYSTFADTLMPILAEACNEAFSLGDDAFLPPSQREGVITLLHKGGDKPVDQLSSFRPITLLNTDYKLLARVLVQRLTPLVDAVTDPTQTAFVPGRWIGDNILQHLEEVDYCMETDTPGCVLFLDFSQAYDRLARDWLFEVMTRMQFPVVALQWVKLMLHGTKARVRYHGWHTPLMDINSGVAQGSPLSPLLWVLAAQPLSSRMQLLQQQGVVGGIALPDGTLAPPCHQHADDTTIHTDTRQSAQRALDLGVRPFERASNSRLNVDKCLGLELGQSAPFAGVDPYTGITFPAASEPPVRHLGVLISHDREGAVQQMYATRIRAIHASIRHWSNHALTYMGRLHVAKSVLASSLYHHATFVHPPPAALASINQAISHYISHGALLEGLGPVGGRPPGVAVEALPKRYGGLGRVDVPTQVAALQAKVAAMLLHPRSHPWKVLMKHAFARAFPALGCSALVSQCRPSSGAGLGLGTRRLAYWKSFAAVRPFRCVKPHILTSGHVQSERLLHNACIAPPGQSKLTTLPSALPPDCFTVGALKRALASEDPQVVAAAQSVYRLLPQSWQEHAQAGPCRAAVWEVSSCGTWVRFRRPQQQPPLGVMSDGRLWPRPGQPPGSTLWAPAAVTFAPCPRQQHTLVALQVGGGHLSHVIRQIHKWQPYLLGKWSHAPVDPNVWGVSQSMPVSHFVARVARERMLHATVRAAGRGYVPGEGVCPRIWGMGTSQPAGSLVAWETRMLQHLANRRYGLGPSHAAGVSRAPQGIHANVYDAAWMHPSPARALPIDRARHNSLHAQATAVAARRDDSVDAIAFTTHRKPWAKAYDTLWACGLDREASHFAWRLLHRGLPCGAVRLTHIADRPTSFPALHTCLCSSSACTALVAAAAAGAAGPWNAPPVQVHPPLETFTHMFWECPSVQGAVRWLWSVWAAIAGSEPPWAPAVLIIGQWQPSDSELILLWQHLRVVLLHTMWVLRQRRYSTGRQHTSMAIVAAAKAALTKAIQTDFFVATKDLPSAAGLGSVWFRGRGGGGGGDLAAFKRKWCRGDVLAKVVNEESEQQRRLVVCVPSTWPGMSVVDGVRSGAAVVGDDEV